MMVVLNSIENKATNSNEMNFYCSMYCKYNSVCDKKNKTFVLKSTIRASELFKAKKDFNFDYLNFPYRSLQLLDIIEKLVNPEIEGKSGK